MRLYLFELGRIRTGEPILGYLVRTADGKNVLIDTGYCPGTLGEQAGAEPALLEASPEQLVINQLARIGLSPGDIDYVIVTHLDPDHAGFTGSFPRAQVPPPKIGRLASMTKTSWNCAAVRGSSLIWFRESAP